MKKLNPLEKYEHIINRMENNTFNKLSESWLTIAANFADKDQLESIIQSKYDISFKIFSFLYNQN